ncbi:MAG: TIR domain-containing protein [Actinobacteria bacterium]|nr:TIR domain-containing protein [Actinomycetota bacterium]
MSTEAAKDTILLEDVFKISGVPTHTFVTPSHFNRLKVAVRTAGRGVVIEGPSGIGKSTAVTTALRGLGVLDDTLMLSARSPSDVTIVEELCEHPEFGTAVVDDFHRLPMDLQHRVADLLKLLADAEDTKRKLIVVGINQAGVPLLRHAPDLTNRIDVIRFEAEPTLKITELIKLGEQALDVSIRCADTITEAANGSFYLAQLLAYEACLQAGVIERQTKPAEVKTLYASVKRQVMERQKGRFGKVIRDFARGNKFRPGTRAPYLNMLMWLAESESGTIDLGEAMQNHPADRPSVKATIDNKGIDTLTGNPAIADVFFYQSHSRRLAMEDPHAIFYVKNLDFAEFARDVGFTKVTFDKPYDVALSFAGEDRAFAERLNDHLTEEGLAVFYDKAEESRILAEDVEALLGPIYESDSSFVVAVMGPKYGLKRWTLFEASKFKPRLEAGEVIPVWSTEVPQSGFDETYRRGGISYDPRDPLDPQAEGAARAIAGKVTGR